MNAQKIQNQTPSDVITRMNAVEAMKGADALKTTIILRCRKALALQNLVTMYVPGAWGYQHIQELVAEINNARANREYLLEIGEDATSETTYIEKATASAEECGFKIHYSGLKDECYYSLAF